MKKITILHSIIATPLLYLLILVVSTSNLLAQTYGNKDIITKTFPLEQITTLEINLSADIIVDMAGKSEITITTDSNLLPHIDRSVNNGYLDLTQKKWIQPSGKHVIVIGAPALAKLISDAHSRILIKNMVADKFDLATNVGKIQLQGSVTQLNINNEHAKIDASELYAQNATINITSWGRVTARVENQLNSKVSNGGILNLVNQPKERLSAPSDDDNKKENDQLFEKADFIDFKIKNGSLNRRHFVVVGPKKDGSFFSYGFPLWPGQVKEERWSVGTKIYQTNKLGLRKLLVTIEGSDVGKVVKL